MTTGGGGIGPQGPGVGDGSSGLDGPKESLFEVLKPALVLVGMLAVFFLLLYVLG